MQKERDKERAREMPGGKRFKLNSFKHSRGVRGRDGGCPGLIAPYAAGERKKREKNGGVKRDRNGIQKCGAYLTAPYKH